MKRSDKDRAQETGFDPEPSSDEGMLDLPLDLPETQWTGDGESEAPRDPAVRPSPAAPSPARRGWVVLSMVVLAVGLALYFVVRPAPPRAGAIPETVDFRERRLHSSEVELELVIVNQGEKPMTVAEIEVIGEAAAEYRVVAEDCSGRPLAGQERCPVKLAFSPSEMGPRLAALEVRGELANSPATFSLAGVGVAPLVEVDQSAIEFGRHAVAFASEATKVSVSNTGTADLHLETLGFEGPSAADFVSEADLCTGKALPPGGSCTVRLLFRPRAAGERRAAFIIRSDAATEAPPIRLAGTGEWSGPALELSLQAMAFGDKRVGAPPAEQTIRLTNRHEARVSGIRVTLASDSEGFSLIEEDCGRSIEPGASCGVVVAFTPVAVAEVSTSVEFRHASMEERLEVPISGRGVAPELVFRESELDFERLRLETESHGRTVILENAGTASAAIEVVEISGSEESAFIIRDDKCSSVTLETDSRCSLVLAFKPLREGRHRAELTIRPAPDRGPESVVLRGIGVAPRLQLDRELLEFGEVRRTTHRDIELVLANSGTAGLSLAGLRLAGEAARDFRLITGTCPSGGGLAPGARCRLRVRFAPASADGRRNAKLLLEHDGVSGPGEVLLGGTALPPPVPRLSTSPLRMDFGPQPVGERSAILTLTIRNTGTGRLDFRDFVVAGAHASDFYIVPATCDVASFLVPDSECTLGVRFVPTVAGARQGKLIIRSTSARGDRAVELVGEGLASQKR